LGHYNDKFNLSEREMSVAPMFMDRKSSYVDAPNANPNVNDVFNGIQRSPFTRYGENSYIVPRRAYNGGFQITPDSTTPERLFHISIQICEPVICPPLSFGDELKGLCNFNQATLSMDFSTSDLSTWLSAMYVVANTTNQYYLVGDGSGTATTGTISEFKITPGTLLCNYVIPKDPLPAIVHLPYTTLSISKTAGVTLANPSTTQPAIVTIDSFNFPLSAIPKRAYLWLENKSNARTMAIPNTYIPIERLTFVLGGSDVNFSQADPHQLYLMSARNGCDLSWTEFHQGALTGSVVCVDFAKDVGLGPDMYVGKSCNMNATFKASFAVPPNSPAVSGQLTVVYVYDGYIALEKGGNVQTYNTLFAPNQSEADLEEAELMPWVRDPNQAFYGGASMRDIGSKIYKVVGSKIIPSARWVASQIMRNPDKAKSVAKLVLDVIPGGEQLMDFAKAVDKFLPQELKDRARDALIGSGRLMTQEGAGVYSGGMKMTGGASIGKSKKSMLDMYRK
jgi:hypothetical protein